MTKTIQKLAFFLFLFQFPAFAKSFFWNIEGTEVFLLGSIHLADSSLYPLAAEIDSAWNRSEILVVEADPTGPQSSAIQQFMMKKMLQPKVALRSLLSEREIAQVDSLAKEFGIPSQALLNTEPWISCIMLTQGGLQKLGHSPNFGVDQHFLRKSKATERAVWELENGVDQLQVFADLSTEEQKAFFEQTLKDLHKLERQFTLLLDYWKEGNAEALADYLWADLLSNQGLKNFGEKLLKNRNEAWVQKIIPWAKEKKKVFIVVGAAHLVGVDNVLEGLEKNGFKIREIPTTTKYPQKIEAP